MNCSFEWLPQVCPTLILYPPRSFHTEWLIRLRLANICDLGENIIPRCVQCVKWIQCIISIVCPQSYSYRYFMGLSSLCAVLTFPAASYLWFPLCYWGHSRLTSGKTLLTAALFSHTPQWLTSAHTVVYFSQFVDHCDSAWFSPEWRLWYLANFSWIEADKKQPLLRNTDFFSKR